MTTATLEPTALPEEQTENAADAAQAFHHLLQLFVGMLTDLANGNGVVVMPAHAELSTQQAADMLNVSRPYLVKLIEEHQLPARKVGTHRRVLLSDLLDYKRRDDQQREGVLRELAQEAQELGLGYE